MSKRTFYIIYTEVHTRGTKYIINIKNTPHTHVYERIQSSVSLKSASGSSSDSIWDINLLNSSS